MESFTRPSALPLATVSCATDALETSGPEVTWFWKEISNHIRASVRTV